MPFGELKWKSALIATGASLIITGTLVKTMMWKYPMDEPVPLGQIRYNHFSQRIEDSDTLTARIIDAEKGSLVYVRPAQYEAQYEQQTYLYELLTFEGGTRLIAPFQSPDFKKGTLLSCVYMKDPNNDGKISFEEILLYGYASSTIHLWNRGYVNRNHMNDTNLQPTLPNKPLGNIEADGIVLAHSTSKSFNK